MNKTYFVAGIKASLLAAILCALGSGFCSPNARADAQDDARKLKDEALSILKANADIDGKPEDMAKCIFDLEKAANILEAARDTDSDLAKEVNSQLYWARKRSTLAIDAALDKLKGAAGANRPSTPKPPSLPKSSGAKAVEGNGDDPFAASADAKKAFETASKFAQSHGDDDYVVSLNWFLMASQYPGNDYSLKALTLGREAQARFKAKNPNSVKEVLPDTPEMKMVIEADALAASGQHEKAIPIYQSSLRLKESAIAHRKLGQSYYARAMDVKEKVIANCETTYKDMRSARESAMVERRVLGGGVRRVLNPNDPNYQAASRKFQAAFKEADVAFDLFDKAQAEFRSVLKFSPGNKDLTSAGLIGICMSQKPDAILRSKAKSHLSSFLKDYKPINDDERLVYEFCKTELDKLNK